MSARGFWLLIILFLMVAILGSSLIGIGAADIHK